MEGLEKIKCRGKFISKLPKYNLVSLIVRFFAVSIIAVIALRLIVYAMGGQPLLEAQHKTVKITDYLLIIFVFNLLSESIILVDNILDRFLPIPERLKERYIVQIISGILLIFLIFNLFIFLDPRKDFNEITRTPYYMGNAIGMVFVFFQSSILLLVRMMEEWVYSQQRIDEMKKDKLKQDYNALQDQLNPHFLFNNLSVLKSLIIYDKDAAVNFTENFTDVYRYVLQSRDSVLVELKKEEAFIESYIALHKERLGKGLIVKFDIEKVAMSKKIAPLTLQLLVENAIKHNIASKDMPLKINIKTENNALSVSNSLQLKEASYSTHTGLNNLNKRYRMITARKIEINETVEDFIVKIPLL